MADVKFSKAKDWSISGIAFDVARDSGAEVLYYGNSDFQVYAFDTAAEKPEPIPFAGEGHESYVTAVAKVGSKLITGGYDCRLIWWDAEKRERIEARDAHEKWIRSVAVSPDGRLLASVADDMTCRLWDADSGEPKATFREHPKQTPHHYPSMLFAVAFSADGKLLATADKAGRIVVRDVETAETAATLEAPRMYTWDPRARRHSIGGIRSLAFSADGTQLAAGGIGRIGNIDHLGGPARVEVFDWKTGKQLHELEDNKMKGLVERLEFHPDGRTLLTAGGDHNGFVTVYDLESGKVAFQEKAPMHIHGHVMDADWKTLYAVGHGRIAKWESAG